MKLIYRILPIAALAVVALYVEARRKSEAKTKTSPSLDPDPKKTPPPLPKAKAKPDSKKAKPKAKPKKVKAKAEVKVEAPDAPNVSKALKKAMDKLSPKQAKAFLELMNSKPPKAVQEIPGVGASMADKIKKGRPYTSPADLLEVSGIGERRLIEFLEWVRGQ